MSVDPDSLTRVATGVLVDANVLFSKTLRDWLFMLRNETGGSMFTIYTTEDILAEVLYKMRRAKPEAPGRLIARVHDHIVEQIDDRIVDYEVDGTYPGPDPNDAHVHAAAVASGAQKLLTSDRGFTRLESTVAARLPYEVHTPDTFLVLVDDSAPTKVLAVTMMQARYWLKARGGADLPGYLRAAGCPRFAERVRCHIQQLTP